MTRTKADEVRDWLAKAASDLKIARREMAAPDPATDAVCFHFQQAVEKTLKAWLTWHGVAFRPIHDLEAILAACEGVDPTFVELRGATALNPYAVGVRYPDHPYFPTVEEMKEAGEIAANVETFVSSSLRSAGFGGSVGTTSEPEEPSPDCPPSSQ